MTHTQRPGFIIVSLGYLSLNPAAFFRPDHFVIRSLSVRCISAFIGSPGFGTFSCSFLYSADSIVYRATYKSISYSFMSGSDEHTSSIRVGKILVSTKGSYRSREALSRNDTFSECRGPSTLWMPNTLCTIVRTRPTRKYAFTLRVGFPLLKRSSMCL